MRNIIHLNFNWNYIEHSSDRDIALWNSGETVDLPHTTHQTPFHYFDESLYQTVCVYQKKITLPQSAQGKRVFLVVGAAAHSAEVFVDGKPAGAHKGGYTAFTVELTNWLTPGREALLAIRVDSRESQNIPPFGNVVDYMTYGGLYREVRLEIREQSYIEDVFVLPEIKGGDGVVKTQIKLEKGADCTLERRVFRDGRLVAEGEMPVVKNADLWQLDDPALYTLETRLLKNGEVIDSVTARFGFRTAVFKADGFYLNGKKVKLVGLNRHQSYPYVGYAMPASVQKADADILKNELGLNAVRTSHYPQSPHFIDRCDELGLLVFTEIPGWQHIGDKEWKRLAEKSVEEMVAQYRNHPSIILWGVRINESRDDDAFYARTNKIAHLLDSTRQTGGVRCYKKSSLLEDVYTYNDFVHEGNNPGCEPKKAVTPDASKPYLISEYGGHMFPGKSFDCEEHRLEHALRHAKILNDIAAQEDIAGSFGWCMFDYNTHRDFGSGDRICYHGVCDMFRNKKLAADVYAANGSAPVLSVSSSMDIGEHPAGYRGRVCVFTNADSVRFYINDTFIHEYAPQNAQFPHLKHPPIEIDDFIGSQMEDNEGFQPKQGRYVRDILNDSTLAGMNHLSAATKLKAAYLMARYGMRFEDAYALYGKNIGGWGGNATVFRFEAIRDGKVVKTAVKTPMTQTRLEVLCSHTDLVEAQTYDVAALRIRMTDENGNTLPFYNGAVDIQSDGALGIIGPQTVMLRGGMGGTYLRTKGEAGSARLTLSAQGCEDVCISFHITKEDV